MKTLEDARQLRGRILSAFEMAETRHRSRATSGFLTFVVIGAGPTGVELAGQVAELAKTVLPREFRWVDTGAETRVMLVEAAPTVLRPFDPKLQRYTQRRLEKMGVEVRVNTAATAMYRRQHHRERPGGPGDDRGPHQDLGRRGAGLAAGEDAGGRHGRADRPRGAGGGAAGLHPARASGGVRDRRHGVAQRPAGRGAAGDAGRQVRREGHPGQVEGQRHRRSRSSTSTRAVWRPSVATPRWRTPSG